MKPGGLLYLLKPRCAVLAAAACFGVAFAWPRALSAQVATTWAGTSITQANGTMLQVPLARPVSRRSKLAMTVDTRWANNYGYRPIEVTIASPKALPADRLVTIRMYCRWWSRQYGSTIAEQDFELPAGSTSASTLIAFPQYQLTAQVYWWEVWVDGVKDRDLSLDEQLANSTMVAGIGGGAGGGVSCLVVGPPSSKRTLTTTGNQEMEFLSLPVPDFPHRWIDYTCLDVISLSQSELTLLSTTNPQALEAMRRWVQAGGQLWVTDVGAELEQLDAVSKLLQVDSSLIESNEDSESQADKREDESLAVVGWRPIRFRRGNPEGQAITFMNLATGRTRVVRDPEEIDRLQGDRNFVVTSQQYEPVEQERPRRWPADSRRVFVEQRSGLGAVRAFRDTKQTLFTGTFASTTATALGAVTNAFGPNGEFVSSMMGTNGPDDPARMATPLNMALRSTERWEARHGMTPDEANRDFAKLLVPGVGLAPVTEFQVLITLFVLLIGPANFWLLKRFRRLHLLVITVPLAAVVTTAGLFAYAVLADGFGTAVRAHSFTTLDQRTGETASWTRVSYYSGFAPGEGLTMPDDVAMYPVVPGWNESGVDPSIGGTRELLWENSEAKLTRGWLRSRTPTQYLAIRSGKSPNKLELLSAAGKMRATNQLGTDIEFVLALDRDGNLFLGENLAAGARENLQSIARNDAIRRLRDLVVKNTPQAPDALAAGDTEFADLQRRQMRQNYRRFGLSYGNERLGNNLAHGALSALAGLEGAPALQLPPRSYVAVTKTGAEVVIGMTNAEEVASFHVIVGKW